MARIAKARATGLLLGTRLPPGGANVWQSFRVTGCLSRRQRRAVAASLQLLLVLAAAAYFLGNLPVPVLSGQRAALHTEQRGPAPADSMPRVAPKTYVAIRGAKHSGTSWLRALLQDNFALESPGPGYYGWKHGALRPEDHERLLRQPSHAVVVLLRGALSWLPKMAKQPYSLTFETVFTEATREGGRSSLSCMIRSPWVQKCSSTDIGSGAAAHLGCKSDDLLEMAPNMVKMREAKYRWWLALRDTLPLGQVAIVRYEDLVADPHRELARLERELNLVRLQAEVRPVGARTALQEQFARRASPGHLGQN